MSEIDKGLRIGIAGAGGIGSNLAVHLLRSGYRRLKIIDFDRIVPSNMNRQFFFDHQIGDLKTEALRENLLKINPDADILIQTVKLSGENIADAFSECPVVAEAFDRKEAKKMLVENLLPVKEFIVGACGIGGFNPEQIRVERRPRLTLVGDFTSDADIAGTNSAKVGICAARMALEIMGYLEKNNER